MRNMSANLETPAVDIELEKSVFIPIPKKGNAKECSNYQTIMPISNASKVMLKILQARLQQYMNQEIPDVQAGFRKGRGTRDKLPTFVGSWRKHENSKKKKKPPSTYASLTMQKPLCGSQQTRKFFNRWKYQTTLHIS